MPRQPDELDHAIADAIQDLRDDVWPMKRVVATLEQREAMRVAARKALEDAGHREPKTHEVESVVDGFLGKGYSARIAPEPSAFVFGPGCRIECNGKTFDYDVMRAEIETEKRTKAAASTFDPSRRLEAHARHLRNLDARVKQIERGES